jgi:hypothetical protein
LQRLEDGTLLLRAVAMVPESQLWTLQEPDRSRIARGLDWAARTPPRESDPERLLTSRARGGLADERLAPGVVGQAVTCSR